MQSPTIAIKVAGILKRYKSHPKYSNTPTKTITKGANLCNNQGPIQCKKAIWDFHKIVSTLAANPTAFQSICSLPRWWFPPIKITPAAISSSMTRIKWKQSSPDGTNYWWKNQWMWNLATNATFKSRWSRVVALILWWGSVVLIAWSVQLHIVLGVRLP